MLLGFDFAPAEHDLYYSNIKDALAGDNPRNIRFVEFQRVWPAVASAFTARFASFANLPTSSARNQ